uniref:DNA2/NAM7 helicase-like C-terminal domain-containing protein n=1 Tax=Globodera rostochiensis TaxID=31243 RepID=A0A914IDK5_GLORO
MSALLRMRQRMYPRQFMGGFDESWAVTGMVILLHTVQFTVTVTPSVVDDQNETATFEVQCHWERKEELVDMCKVWRQDQPISKLSPSSPLRCFRDGSICCYNTNHRKWRQMMARGQIVASILARTGARAEPELTWEELADRPELSRMIEGQRETARLMLDPIPRICKQMAPPGTGKTDVATRIIPLNVAVVRAVQQMAENMDEIGWREPMLALFAGSGKAKYREEIAHIGDHLLASAVRAPHLLDGLDVQKKRVVQRYLTACENSPRTANEGKVLLMLTNFPALKKLLVTGDDHQLGVNLQEVPEAVREKSGVDTILENLQVAAAVDKTVLSVNFRSHPAITECIEEAAYAPHGLRLVSGRTVEQMNMLTGLSGIKLPSVGIPLVLIYQTSPMLPDPSSFSQSNPGQTETVMALINELFLRFPGTMRIVCLYAGQASEIGQAIAAQTTEHPDWARIIIATGDSTQGHESDAVIVVTTSSGGGESADAFWNHPRRVNVALSRPRHALFVIGDLATCGERKESGRDS